MMRDKSSKNRKEIKWLSSTASRAVSQGVVAAGCVYAPKNRVLGRCARRQQNRRNMQMPPPPEARPQAAPKTSWPASTFSGRRSFKAPALYLSTPCSLICCGFARLMWEHQPHEPQSDSRPC